MRSEIICEKEIELLNEKCTTYPKKVALSISPRGKPELITLRAFIRKV